MASPASLQEKTLRPMMSLNVEGLRESYPLLTETQAVLQERRGPAETETDLETETGIEKGAVEVVQDVDTVQKGDTVRKEEEVQRGAEVLKDAEVQRGEEKETSS